MRRGYRGAHEQLEALHGKAREHGCWLCPKQASDWAYLRCATTPLWDTGRSRWYSDNLADYAPLCRSCHLKLDWDTRHISLWPEASVESHRAASSVRGVKVAAMRWWV